MLSLILQLLISIREFSRRNLFLFSWSLFGKQSKSRFHAEISESNRGKFAEGDSEVAPNAHTFHFLKFRQFHRKEEKKLGIYIILKKFVIEIK